MTVEPSSTTDQSERKKLVKARWGILRNALMRGAQEEQQQQKHSIHCFPGFNLLKGIPVNLTSSLSGSQSESCQIEKWLTEYRWCDAENHTLEQNIDNMEIAILALAACFPKGKCMRIIRTIDTTSGDGDSEIENDFSSNWLESIKQRCQPSVRVWKASEEEEVLEQKCAAKNVVTTLLVQETSTSTKYQTLRYNLDNTKCNTVSTIVTVESLCDILWTREPRETRLSLDDLISHRKNKGVDNTGNICIWDSERTLAYLLYHYFDDFFSFTKVNSDDDSMSIVCSCHNDSGDPDSCIVFQQQEKDHSKVRVLELGTGMAGLSAVSLGLRLAMRQRKNGDETNESNDNDDESEGKNKKDIHITLTDGNSNGVKNNAINQYLTELNSRTMLKERGIHSNYLDLSVNCATLLWTTDISGEKNTKKEYSYLDQDVILVSDCVHFQNFHAALAITTLRCLRVGGSAIFCQPRRGPSLNNFFNLLSTATSETGFTRSTSLLSISRFSHPIIDQKHDESLVQHSDIYDENLHRPEILAITKLREITENDRMRFISFQQRYNPVKSKITEE
ncbi:unnamed protein product [Pseudo-nitzschia multistriata]|uniref:Calmodulin-lysine N-methyltransferase n=1 Tax=Pseudo-nitzschia multistriata TaxID=183589 RepID=A0A448ZL88_9STRA|nr:unnamed protein product [Pseudo-nitzschia multistriata]